MTLVQRLYNLRETIRLQEKSETNRTPIICSDEAIVEMKRILPRERQDFLCIAGLGQVFVDKYADKFLLVIEDFINNKSNIVSASDQVMQTLKELEKKLVNINKRNKLLYVGDKSTKLCLDAFEICAIEDLYMLLFKQKRQLTLADLNDKKAKNNDIIFKKLVGLLREINKDFREKGQYDLYVGYPFITGEIIGSAEKFDVNAPLVLFPVTLTNEVNKFTLKNDTSRDIIYNNNIILAYLKFNNKTKQLPSNVVDDINEDTFVMNIIDYYTDSNIKISPIASEILPLNAAVAKPPRGEFSISYKMVLGKFSTYSSSMQKDLNDIINKSEINDLLSDLLSKPEDIDMYSDDILQTGETLEENNRTKEQEMFYINTLNSTQENVLIAAERHRELVVQGPPGTGKSQVITSLIANAVLRNKNVLMVSEKKSALDVVYSRLGDLNRYALLVDDVNNKDIFYSQLKKMTDLQHATEQDIEDEVSINVDKYMTALTIIADKMCDKSLFGIEVYKLYNSAPKWKIDEKDSLDLYCKLGANIPKALKAYGYPLVSTLFNLFKSQSMVDKLNEYQDNLAKYPILDKFKSDLSMTDVLTYVYEFQNIKAQYNNVETLPMLKRGKERKRVGLLINDWALKLFVEINDIKFIIDNAEQISAAAHVYNNYITSKQIFDKLNADAKDYFTALKQLAVVMQMPEVKMNELIYRYLLNEFLIRFEKDNRTTLHNINNYNGVLEKLSGLLDQKVKVTKAKLEREFNSDMRYLNSSKRSGEILRLVESKRRPSVSKFTERFSAELFKAVKVWLLTPEVVSEILPLSNGLFDLVIFDEASQMYVEKAVPAIMRAKSVIIAGDSKQLRPNNLGSGRMDIDDEDNDDYDGGIAALEEESLLDVARFKYPPVMLDFHYRSKYEELIAFSNYAFYGGKLNVSPNPISPSRPPIEVLKVDGGIWEDKSNKEEAKRIVELLKTIFAERKNNETIGIITFNSSQRDLIEDYVDDECKINQSFAEMYMRESMRKSNGEDIGLFIKNIENVQGDERDIIIFSIGYAKNIQGKVVNSFGWLNQRGGENRLNVAISRAKTKIYIVLSIDAQDLRVDECKNNGPMILRKYIEYSCAISEGNKSKAKLVLNSLTEVDSRREKKSNQKLAKQLRFELERRGYGVEENVGIGNYNIDIAVLKDNDYVLGLEFDSSLYDISKNTRERDYHRWKYFKLRGWNMHRIWSSAWWENPSRELGKILAKLPK